MFQVAARPAFDHFAGPSFDDLPPSPASALVQLPRKLARPHFTPVTRDALVASNPELADVPIEYVRSGMRAQAAQMLGAVKAVSSAFPASAPKSQLPPAVALPSAGPSAPTHVLAISSSAKGSQTCYLHATHSLVLAVACANLPPLPTLRAGGGGGAPVVPLAIPAADAFAPLHAYLYSGAVPPFLSALLHLQLPPTILGAGPSGSCAGAAHAQLAAQLAQALAQAAGRDVARLMAVAKRVNGVWRNACALGVYDLPLWDALDLAWDAVLGALNLAVRP